MDQTSLKYKTLLNSLYSLVGYAWPLVLTFFVTPFIVFTLGIKEYGIYLFVGTVGIFIGTIDLGLGMAVTKHVAYYWGEKKEEDLKTLIRTSNSLFLGIGLIGLFAYVAVAFLGEKILSGSFSAYSEYSMLFAIVGLTFFVETASRSYPAILNGLQKYDILTKMSLPIFTLSTLGTAAIVYFKGGLYEIFIYQLFIAIITAFVSYIKAIKFLPYAGIKYSLDREKIWKCYSFGLASTINGISGLTLYYFDKLIIPFYIGPSNLTYYNMPGSIASKIPGISGSVTGMIFPMASSLSGEHNAEKLKALYVRSSRLIMIASASITISCISFAYPLLFYWLNQDFAERATGVLIILTIVNFILSSSSLMSNFLLGMGKIKILTLTSFSIAILNIILLIILLPSYGILGAAWAYLFSLAPFVFLFYYCEKHYLHLLGRKKYYLKHILGTLLISSIIISFNMFIVTPLISNLIEVLAAASLSALLYILFYKLFGFFEQEDWDDLYLFLKKIILSPGKSLLNKTIFTFQVFSFGIISRLKRKIKKVPSSEKGYDFIILCIKKTIYAKLAITNINSLHYRNSAHHITIQCDDICYTYLTTHWNKFDYPEKVTLEKVVRSTDKGWQFFKVEAIIDAAMNDKILFDADTFWHEDIVVDREKITLLASCGPMNADKRDALVIEKIFGKNEWGSFTHYVAAFASIPKKLMTEKLAQDMRIYNQMIWNSDLSFIHDDTKRGEILRLSEEFAVNLSTQSNYPQEMVVALKKEDGVKNKKKMESLYYGCKNQINE